MKPFSSWIGRAALAAALVVTPLSAAMAESHFNMRLLSDPLSFDWNLARTDSETPVMMNIMEGLVEFDSHMKVKPLLAQSWSVSADQRTYTFKLRKDVKWSDGKPLKAADFVYSWQRLLNPLTAAPYAYMLFDIEGAEDFNARRNKDFSKVGISAPDDHTLVVKLNKPVAYFIQMLTFWVTFPMRKDVVEKHGASWAQPGKTVVLGPFIPAQYQPQNRIVLKRNDNYHGAKPSLDNVVMRIINDDSTAMNLFKSGQLDYVRPVNFLELGELKGTPSFHNDPYYRTCFLHINNTKYPFNLPKVRQALAMSIDRSKIASALHRDVKPADSLLSESLFSPGKGSALPFDPAQAKKTMHEAIADANTLGNVDLVTFASDENALLAQYLQDQLRSTLGLKVQIKMLEYSTYRTQLELETSPLFFRCWAADYADPDTYFGMFLSSSGNNKTGYKSSKYDDLVKTAAVTPDGPARVKHYKDALELLLRKDAVIVPLYFDSLTYLLNPKVKGFRINELNYAFLRAVSVNR